MSVLEPTRVVVGKVVYWNESTENIEIVDPPSSSADTVEYAVYKIVDTGLLGKNLYVTTSCSKYLNEQDSAGFYPLHCFKYGSTKRHDILNMPHGSNNGDRLYDYMTPYIRFVDTYVYINNFHRERGPIRLCTDDDVRPIKDECMLFTYEYDGRLVNAPIQAGYITWDLATDHSSSACYEVKAGDTLYISGKGAQSNSDAERYPIVMFIENDPFTYGLRYSVLDNAVETYGNTGGEIFNGRAVTVPSMTENATRMYMWVNTFDCVNNPIKVLDSSGNDITLPAKGIPPTIYQRGFVLHERQARAIDYSQSPYALVPYVGDLSYYNPEIANAVYYNLPQDHGRVTGAGSISLQLETAYSAKGSLYDIYDNTEISFDEEFLHINSIDLKSYPISLVLGTPLVWDAVGEKTFETGVKKGVLFVMNDDGTYQNGVAWNGLIGVTESNSGAEETALWADDIKYASMRSAEEFSATIEAYNYPKEFKVCDGSLSVVPGLDFGQQSRKRFGFSYVTTEGNDVSGTDYNYKIHIIYNAYAAPSEKSYQTINDSPDAITHSWEVNTLPIAVTNHKPTSHLIFNVNPLVMNKNAVKEVEKILYGSTEAASRILMPEEIDYIVRYIDD